MKNVFDSIKSVGRKGLVTLLTAGLIGVGTSGCDPGYQASGKFKEYNAVVRQDSNTSMISLTNNTPTQHIFDIHTLTGYDRQKDGVFEEITLDGVNVEYWKKVHPETFEGYPLSQYANSDSLKGVYDSVMAQNAEEAQK